MLALTVPCPAFSHIKTRLFRVNIFTAVESFLAPFTVIASSGGGNEWRCLNYFPCRAEFLLVTAQYHSPGWTKNKRSRALRLLFLSRNWWVSNIWMLSKPTMRFYNNCLDLYYSPTYDWLSRIEEETWHSLSADTKPADCGGRRSSNAIMLICSSYHVSMLDNTELGGLASSYQLYLLAGASLILINFPTLLSSRAGGSLYLS